MKKILLPAALVLSSSLAVVNSAYAVTTASTLNVSATVGLTCTVTTTAVNFGTVDPTLATNVTGGVAVNCPVGTPYTINLDAGANLTATPYRAMTDGVNVLEYVLKDAVSGLEWNDAGVTYAFGSPVNGTGTGAIVNHVINASTIAGAALPAGPYSDIVNVTVVY